MDVGSVELNQPMLKKMLSDESQASDSSEIDMVFPKLNKSIAGYKDDKVGL